MKIYTNNTSITVQWRVQEFVRGGGAENLKGFFFLFFLFNFSRGGVGPLGPPPGHTPVVICKSIVELYIDQTQFYLPIVKYN